MKNSFFDQLITSTQPVTEGSYSVSIVEDTFKYVSKTENYGHKEGEHPFFPMTLQIEDDGPLNGKTVNITIYMDPDRIDARKKVLGFLVMGACGLDVCGSATKKDFDIEVPSKVVKFVNKHGDQTFEAKLTRADGRKYWNIFVPREQFSPEEDTQGQTQL